MRTGNLLAVQDVGSQLRVGIKYCQEQGAGNQGDPWAGGQGATREGPVEATKMMRYLEHLSY